MTKTKILVVGPFPPPVHGMAKITLELSKMLEGRVSVEKCNVAVGSQLAGFRYHSLRFALCIQSLLKLITWRWSGGKKVVIECNGGFGLIYTILQVGLASVLGCNLYVHLHSYAYINKKSCLMSFLVLCMKYRVNFIFLSKKMQDDFASIYKFSNGIVVENSLFVPRGECASGDINELRVGLLSNLDEAKGLYDFVELVRRLVKKGINVKAILAGPCSESDSHYIGSAISELGSALDYRGPLYGEEKKAFFSDVDYFVFPTNYVNEAQPTVVFEAQSYGCLVVSRDMGCISDQLSEVDFLVPRYVDFVEYKEKSIKTEKKKRPKKRTT